MNHREIDQSKNDICIWNLHMKFLHRSCLMKQTNECVNKCNKWNYEIKIIICLGNITIFLIRKGKCQKMSIENYK